MAQRGILLKNYGRNCQVGPLIMTIDHLVRSPDMRVLKTGQGVVEYLRLEGSLPSDQILGIAKSVLLLSEKKINALYL